MKNFKINELNNMMINILDFGFNEVWAEVEKEPDALERCRLRKLITVAKDRVEKEEADEK